MIDRLLSFVAPHHCYGCGLTTSILCQNCEYDISQDDFGRCVWCLRVTADSHQCTECGKRFGTTAAWAIGERTGVLKRLVGDYKYFSAREAANSMARLLDAKMAMLPSGTVTTTVPTISAHVRQRGFDHAALLAKAFAKERWLAYSPLLKRRLHISQHDLNKTERLRLARETFYVYATEVPKDILLIDDIMTTGATLQACVAALRDAGAERVFVAAVARQMMEEHFEGSKP